MSARVLFFFKKAVFFFKNLYFMGLVQKQTGKSRGFESWKVELTAGDCVHPTVISSSQSSLPDSSLIHREKDWTLASPRIPPKANINSFQQILQLCRRAQHFPMQENF